MKKMLFLLLLLLTTSLFATSDSIDAFIESQMKIEEQMLDQNISSEKKRELKAAQVIAYQKFFFQYASEREDNLQAADPYRAPINRLKLRYQGNKRKGYTNAMHRDAVRLKVLKLKQGIRDAIQDTLLATKSPSKKVFNEKVNAIILKYFSDYEPVQVEKYLSTDKNNTITQEIKKALHTLQTLENVSYTLSSETLENTLLIYNTGRFSDSKLFSFINTVNRSEQGQKINQYLSPFHIDSAKILLLLMLVIFIIVLHYLISFIIKMILSHYKINDEDSEYIQSRIGKMFNYIFALLVVHLLVLAYTGFDLSSIYISKAFSVLYVILVTILLYRITNTIAYMKIESLKSSKVLKNEVINLSLKSINSLIILLAFIAILKIFGVDLTAILSGLGIAGAAVAFAAKDSIANVFGSISILMGDVFEQGDWIESKEVNGTVVEIGLRASTIRTFDNALISIPNFQLANNSVKNWSRRSVGRRIKMDIGVTYQSDFSDIKHAIEEIREMLKAHEGIANERTTYQNAYRQSKLVSTEDYKGVKRTTLVYMDTYGASSINILVYCFSRTVDWAEWLAVKEDVMYKIAEILEKNNLEFAYPTMTIHQADEEEEVAKTKQY